MLQLLISAPNYNAMTKWDSKKLSELGVMRGAGADKLTQPGEKPIRLVNYMDVYTNHRINNTMTFQEVTATDREIAQCDLKRGDVLFTPSSETPDDIAHAAVVVEDLPCAIYSYHLTRFRPYSSDSFDTEFLGYLFNNSLVHRYFWARACGLTRFTLNRADFNNLAIQYPEKKAEQTAIANALGTVDSAIAATRESIAKAERLQKGLMQQLLTGRIKPDGSFCDDADFDHDERIGSFPKGWKVQKLRQVVRLRNGKANITSNLRDKADTTFCYPVFGGNGLTGWSDRYLLEDPMVVLGRVGEYCGAVHRTPAKAWVTDNALYAADFPEPIDLGFLFYLLTSLRLNRWKATTGQPKITQSEILNIRVAIPRDTEEQKEIANKLDGVQQLVDAKRAKITALQRLKKSLMQNLLTGRIRMPVAGGEERGGR